MSESCFEREARLTREPQRGEQEVSAFGKLQLQKLAENAFKGSWKGQPLLVSLERLRGELRELEIEVRDRATALRYGTESEEWLRANAERIGREAADVGNYAMVLADTAGALEEGR